MFDFSFDSATKKTAGQLAVGSGIALFVYNKFERPSAPMGIPLALIGGGVAILALSSNEPPPSHYVAAGPGEQKDLAAIQTDATKLKVLPWAVGGAAAIMGLLLYSRAVA